MLAPPTDGVYLGAFEAEPGGIHTLEQILERKVVFAPFLAMDPAELAARGYLTASGPFEATPVDSLPGFTVDRLLMGHYDDLLLAFAEQYRPEEHGKTLFFETMREVNGVLSLWMGGFGPNGDKNRLWAEENGHLSDAFDVAALPTGHLSDANLYAGLGDDNVCDGLERAVAAQRYFFDFFVHRQSLDAVTFGTMGWAVSMEPKPERGRCYDAKLFLELLDGYYDWVSINWYMGFDGDREPSNEQYLGALDELMREVREAAPGKPVMLSELGFCDEDRPGKVRQGMSHILEAHPEIAAVAIWSSDSWGGLDCRLLPDQGGNELRQIVDGSPGSFHSCPSYTDGTSLPGCNSRPREDIPRSAEEPGRAPVPGS